MAFPELHINNPILKRELDAAFQTLLTMKGNMYFVHSGTGSAYSAGTDINHPMATIDDAVNKCTANQGDIIIVLPGHAETIIAASAIDIDIAGIKIFGIGEGEDRPKITLTTATDASIEFAANSTVFKNFIIISGIDALTGPMLLKGVGLDIDVETRDSTNLIEATYWFLSETTCNHLKLKAKHIGFTTGSGNTSYINLVGSDYARIDVDYFGLANTSVVEFTGAASINALIKGFIYNSTDTTYAKFVVDTISGTTWAFWGTCGENGTSVQGSQDTPISGLDTSAVAAALAVIDAFHDVPVADVADNVVISDVVGNKDDTVAGTSVIALLKQIYAREGAPAGASMSADIAAIKAVADTIEAASVTEIAEILAAVDAEIAQIIAALVIVDEFQDVPGIDSAANAQTNEVIGNKSDTVAGNSLIALCKQVIAALLFPTEDLATDATIAQVVGKKSDTVAGTSLVALAKQIIAAIVVVDGLLDVPTEDLATDATINQVVGKKSDTVAGTSLVALAKQIIVDTNFIGTIVNAGGTATIGGLLGDFANVTAVTRFANIQTEADKIETPSNACNRQAGKTQIFTKNITAAANAGLTTVGTITDQSCFIKRVVLRANGVTTADLTSAAIMGGASQAVEFISAATAVTANINADDEQLAYSGGGVVLKDTKTIVIDLQGTGATAVDLDVTVEYEAIAAGGYIV